MTRCGCSRGGSGGVLVAGPGVEISGDGTPQRPRTIEIVADPHVCDLAEECMSRGLCRGLSYDGSCIGIDLSEDPGNQLSFAAEDGGLYGTCDAVLSCGQLVDNLPDFVRGSTFGAGANNGPAVAASYERAITMGLPMSMAAPSRLQDGVFAVPLVAPSSSYATPSSPLTWQQVSSHSAQSITFTDDPAWDRLYAQRGPSTLDEMIRICRGRHVLVVTAPREASTPAEGRVQDLVDVITRYCAQRGVIVTTNGGTTADRARLAAARAAGIDTGVHVTSAASAADNPPATLVAEGVKWVFATTAPGITDQMITGYVAAGLDVVLTRAKLHVDVARAETLGMRGVLADDPGYAFRKTCGLTRSPWDWPNWDGAQVGAAQILRDNWTGDLGETTLAEGWWGGGVQPVTTGWRFPNESSGRTAGATLLGWAFPLASPAAYTITWEQWWGQLDSGKRNQNAFGLLIAAPDDAFPLNTGQTQGPADGTGRASGYLLGHSVGDASTTADNRMAITKLTKGAASGPTVTAASPAPLPPSTWVRFRVVVTAGSITYQRLTGDTVDYQVAMTDTAYRGHYLWIWKTQGTGAAGNQRMATAYRNLTIT
ncbi:hypothetical protein [Streptomyces sp. NPDC088739]|uniref:hypothetical protein n=1 Tax=Streptomyces sp. NPDC088739 TaxID=3365882 RepID=UPI0037F6D0A9